MNKQKNYVFIYFMLINASLILLDQTYALEQNILFLSKTRLNHLSEKHKILSQNIANLNTPGYKTLSIHPNYSKNNNNFKLYTTSNKHFSSSKRAIVHRVGKKVKILEVKQNGNNVFLEKELPKISKNNNDYNSTLKMYQSLHNLLITAINSK